ncbi:uncharacterized protein CXQ87_004448 [Candidozyma duobushaemuli]|uniref:GB1/RHD3-type G domain-containing protein n=2 Tax=Candidozyma TaxID=3303203 RepID=A0ABX8I9E4_9ASCO|nr:uncharacterized protein CXQ87_004448 [[Candida] duobushaemulonis]PVH16890.1 hypothetical protein CXQ87_004448 [[Candida] duobushaemulonis]QWU89677.1 hypothetical protein CA3LBN_004025 [[Candida] haemuloni]
MSHIPETTAAEPAETLENAHIESTEATDKNSRSSSSSSFVPVDNIQDAIQVIDENKQFNRAILDYISSSPDRSGSGDYRIISVFGSQSTGKSTLLNHLFNTNFDVMDEVNRQQTTKGIWLAHSPGVTHSAKSNASDNVLVMDVEGTDGRERGEDQDFERKAALFAMSTSEVLIVNLWETQVGLYQGANMGLLKTVFEVNLSLFGKAKLRNNDHKVLLLFVIRDHLGVTPVESLARTIEQDLLKIWDNLNKPADVAHLEFTDFFDLAFHTLSHKVLQLDKFKSDIKLLGNRFVDKSDPGFLFKPFYHHDIPIEGWTMYAQSCWDQIDNNKDLDLPTQQILVAKFKCDEIASSCLEEFEEKFKAFETDAHEAVASGSAISYDDIGKVMKDINEDILEEYDSQASKYNKSVFEQKRVALTNKVNDRLGEVFGVYADHLSNSTIKDLGSSLKKKSSKFSSFEEKVATLTAASIASFVTSLTLLSLGGSLPIDSQVKSLKENVNTLVAKQQVVELNNIISKSLKKINNGLSTTILDEIAKPDKNTWNRILDSFTELKNNSLSKYQAAEGYNFGLGTEAHVNDKALSTLEFKAWELFDQLIQKYISKDNLLNILKDRFDEKFRYDENGVPKLYQNAMELESSFADSKDYALEALPILSFARLSNGAEVRPKYDIRNKSLQKKYATVQLVADEEDEDDEELDSDAEEEDGQCFAQIVTEKEKSDVLIKFRKETDAKFVETKRSIMQSVTQIPLWVYVVIVVLGWNEFMAVLRNPFFFTLLVMFGAGGYILWHMGLLGPSMMVAQRAFDEAVAVGKTKLREILIDEPEQHGHNLGTISGNSNRRSAPLDRETDEPEVIASGDTEED